MGAAATGLPKQHLPVMVGVHHNQLGTDQFRRDPLATGGSLSVGSYLYPPLLVPWPGLSVPSATGTHWDMSHVPATILESGSGNAGDV